MKEFLDFLKSENAKYLKKRKTNKCVFCDEELDANEILTCNRCIDRIKQCRKEYS
jgi:hypothetical protein